MSQEHVGTRLTAEAWDAMRGAVVAAARRQPEAREDFTWTNDPEAARRAADRLLTEGHPDR